MRNSLGWIIKVALTVAVIAAIVSRLDAQSIVNILLSSPPAVVGAGLLLVSMQVVLAGKRLSVVVSVFGHVLKLHDAVRITLEGMFFSQTFVSFVGGDAQRIWRVRRCGLSFEQATSAITLDRLIGIIAGHLLLLASLPWLLSTIAISAVRIGLILLALAGVGGIVVALGLGFSRGRTGLSARVPLRLRRSRLLQLVLEASTVGRYLFAFNVRTLEASLLSVAIASGNSLIFFLVLMGWHIPAPDAFGSALLVTAVMEIAMLPISIAGWGVREGTAIVAFSSYAVPADIALGSSVIYGLIVLAIALVGGAIWLFDQREIRILAAGDTLAHRNVDTVATEAGLDGS